jgi:hypothetical protein
MNSNEQSECNAIALVPFSDNVIAVGWKNDNQDSANKLGLLVYTKSNL